MDEQTKLKLIEMIIADYYANGYTGPDYEGYNHGYADAAMNVIQTIIDIDPPGLE